MHRLIALVLLVGCQPATYAWTPASARGVTPKPDNCAFEVLTAAPDDGFEEIGTLEHYNGEPPKDAEGFRKAVGQQVCGAGGDAVVAKTNDKGRYVGGTVIEYTRRPDPTAQ